MLWSLLLLPCNALAQAVVADRPVVPSAGMAAEGGPASMWVNPANMAYDPDPRYALLVGNDLGQDPTSIAATAGARGMQVGVHNVAIPDGSSDWSFDYATSLKLPERFAVGLRMGWHVLQDEPNYVAYDVGGSWRPLSWVGFSAVARNISSPDPRALAQSGVGAAFRPFGNFATFGLDYEHTFLDDGPGVDVGRLTARLRPARGLYLRGGVDTQGTFGGGLEVYFGQWGGGAHAAVNGEDTGVVAMIGTDEPGEAIVRSGNRVPVLVLDRAPAYEPRVSFLGGSEGPSWIQVVELLRRAEEDPTIDGLIVSLGSSGMSWAQRQEIRNRITSLELAGKPVVAYLHGGADTGDYYVATAASSIVMHPSQDLFLVGLEFEMTYLRGALDLVGVEPQFVRRAEYKSAVEQYMNTEPSAPSLEQMDALLTDIDTVLRTAIVDGRKRPAEEVAQWIDGGPWTAEEALAKGLVDALAYPDEVESYVTGRLGRDHISLVSLTEDMPQKHSGWREPSQIMLVYVEGPIVPGQSTPGGMFGARATGSDTVVAALERARDDDQVKAVVIRVDSPGGSSFASDEIHRAVEQVQAEGKPVVVSFGGVAASGGYYVATGADAIWAEPTTITGSIGVYSGKFAMGGLFDRVGVSTTTLSRGRNAGVMSSMQPWDDVQRARMQDLVDHTYADFKSKVAEGRNLSPEQVEQLARGRVWSGAKAAEIGLVDGIGGLHDAIKDARTRAGIPDRAEIGFVSADESGFLMESLAPAQMSVGAWALQAAAPGVAARLDQQPAEALGLPRLGDAYDPFVVMATHPDEVWMMDPWVIQIEAK
jgi:protease-4